MRINLFVPPWMDVEPPAVFGLEEVILGAWTEAATKFAADWLAMQNAGRRGPVGVQKYLNRVLDERFVSAGWDEFGGTYTKDEFWLRVTFRHQMSAGSNLIDALKATSKGGFDTVVVAAATRGFLDLISVADAPALTSFEKLQAELVDLEGVISVPILLAALEPGSRVSPTVRAVLHDPRRKRAANHRE